MYNIYIYIYYMYYIYTIYIYIIYYTSNNLQLSFSFESL